MGQTLLIAPPSPALATILGAADLATRGPRAAGAAGLALSLHELDESMLTRALAAQQVGSTAALILRADVDVRANAVALRLDHLITAALPPDVVLELTLRSSGAHDAPSSPRADADACDKLRHVLQATQSCRTLVALRPQPGLWLERIEHAVRLVMRINQPRLGITLDLAAWRPDSDAQREATLDLVVPRLCNVVFDPTGAETESLVAAVAGGLRRRGYAGPYTIVAPRSDAAATDWRPMVAAAARLLNGAR